MTQKTMTYFPPQTCAEPIESPFALCQASGSEFDPTEPLGDITWE